MFEVTRYEQGRVNDVFTIDILRINSKLFYVRRFCDLVKCSSCVARVASTIVTYLNADSIVLFILHKFEHIYPLVGNKALSHPPINVR